MNSMTTPLQIVHSTPRAWHLIPSAALYLMPRDTIFNGIWERDASEIVCMIVTFFLPPRLTIILTFSPFTARWANTKCDRFLCAQSHARRARRAQCKSIISKSCKIECTKALTSLSAFLGSLSSLLSLLSLIRKSKLWMCVYIHAVSGT
jgi:hypothetical protein